MLTGLLALGLFFATVGDARAAYLYYAEFNGGTIRRANLDGTGSIIVVSGLSIAAGPALDLANGKMYLCDLGSGTIRAGNLDGTGQQVLIQGLNGPAFITLDLSVLPPLNVQSVAKSDSSFTLQWNALLGRAYQMQFKTILVQTDWSNLGTRVTATNTTMTATDSALADPHKFYRVQLLP